MTNACFLALGVLFLPAVIFASRHALGCFHQAGQRPGMLILVGLFFVLAGMAAAYVVVLSAKTGRAPCPLKGCLAEVDLAAHPLTYWLSVLAWYAIAVLVGGFGIASFRRATHSS